MARYTDTMLPPGWEVFLTGQGRPFYVAHHLRATTFDHPYKGPLPDGWQSRVDPRTGVEFFLNGSSASWADPRRAYQKRPALDQPEWSLVSDPEAVAIDFDCRLCGHLLYEPSSTRCGHNFCTACLADALADGNRTCAVCAAHLGFSLGPSDLRTNALLAKYLIALFGDRYHRRGAPAPLPAALVDDGNGSAPVHAGIQCGACGQDPLCGTRYVYDPSGGSGFSLCGGCFLDPVEAFHEASEWFPIPFPGAPLGDLVLRQADSGSDQGPLVDDAASLPPPVDVPLTDATASGDSPLPSPVMIADEGVEAVETVLGGEVEDLPVLDDVDPADDAPNVESGTGSVDGDNPVSIADVAAVVVGDEDEAGGQASGSGDPGPVDGAGSGSPSDGSSDRGEILVSVPMIPDGDNPFGVVDGASDRQAASEETGDGDCSDGGIVIDGGSDGSDGGDASG